MLCRYVSECASTEYLARLEQTKQTGARRGSDTVGQEESDAKGNRRAAGCIEFTH